MISCVLLNYKDPDDLLTYTLRFATHGIYQNQKLIDTGIASGADEYYFEPRLRQPANFSSKLFEGKILGGKGSIGIGTIELINVDGKLDYLKDMVWDGQLVRQLIITDDNRLYDFGVYMSEQLQISTTTCTIVLRDPIAYINNKLQPTLYLGNNTFPEGVEGDSSLTDKPKPLLFGSCQNITPVLVNSSLLIYQVHDGAVTDIATVYDMGVTLNGSPAAYSSLQDMYDNAPVSGAFKVYPAGGMFRLNATPAGAITCDAVSSFGGTFTSLLSVVSYVHGFRWAGDLPLYAIGYYVDSDTTIQQFLDDVFAGSLINYTFNQAGIMVVRELKVPSIADRVVLNIDSSHITSFDIEAGTDDSRGIPNRKAIIKHTRNWTVQTGNELAGSVLVDGRSTFLAEEYRQLSTWNAQLIDLHPLATDITLTTCLQDETQAGTFATTAYQAAGYNHDLLKINIKLPVLLPQLSYPQWQKTRLANPPEDFDLAFMRCIWNDTANHKLHFWGFSFDLATNIWSTNSTVKPGNKATHYYNGYLYWFESDNGNYLVKRQEFLTGTTSTYIAAPVNNGDLRTYIYEHYLYIGLITYGQPQGFWRVDLDSGTPAWSNIVQRIDGSTEIPPFLGTLIGIDGYIWTIADSTYQGAGSVEVHRIDLGTLTTWEAMPSLPEARYYPGAVVMGRELITVGATSDVPGDGGVYKLDLDNINAGWVSDADRFPTLEAPLYEPQLVEYNGDVFCLGTYTDQIATGSVGSVLLSNPLTVELGNIISVNYPRYNYGYNVGSGKPMMLIGYSIDLKREKAELMLWG